MAKREEQALDPRAGFILIDAWRAEASLFERDGKLTIALRLRRLADKAQWLMSIYAHLPR